MSESVTEPGFIEEGFEEALSQLSDSLGQPVRSVLDRLYVVEFAVRTRGSRKNCTVQFIVNPWSWPKQAPTVDLVGVDYNDLPTGVSAVPDSFGAFGEGRFRLTGMGSELRQAWERGTTMASFARDVVAPWVTKQGSNVRVRSNPSNRGAYDLLYPGGVFELHEIMQNRAREKNLRLLDRTEEAVERRRMEQEENLVLERTRTAILAAEDLKSLDAVDLSILPEESREDLEALLSERRVELDVPEVDPFDLITESDDDPLGNTPVGNTIRDI